MEIKRDYYLKRLINMDGNGLIKIITGIRRCGKSYLLDPLFKNYLLESGVDQNHIIKIDLDIAENKQYLDPDVLNNHILSLIQDEKKYYILLDEIQLVPEFESILNGFLHYRNLEVYVTGSNSKFLSTDIITEFRGRGIEMRVFPLSFSEYKSVHDGSNNDAWNDFTLYGSLPAIFLQKNDIEKKNYLNSLKDTVYLNDVVERNNIQNRDDLEKIIEIISSNIGSLTNPQKISDTFNTTIKSNIDRKTVSKYLLLLENAFIISKVERYDVKGRQYIDSPYKYYFSDIGLRNALLNFRQTDLDHIMENVIYNELLKRGYSVDIGIVVKKTTENGKDVRKNYEVDFVCNRGSNKYYIQSAYAMSTEEKLKQEQNSLLNINDSFKKIIVVKDDIKVMKDDNGIVTIGLFEFLLNENSLEL